MGDELTELQSWYRAQCDGDWEHQHGVHIGTLDNPGWYVDIDVTETDLADKPFEAVVLERAEHDWIHCKVQDSVFKARGGPGNLGEMLRMFLSWSCGSGKRA